MDLTVFYELLNDIKRKPEAKTIIMPLDIWFKFPGTEIFMNYGRIISTEDDSIKHFADGKNEKIELFDLEITRVSPHLMESDYLLTEKVITKTGIEKIIELEKIIEAAEGGK